MSLGFEIAIQYRSDLSEVLASLTATMSLLCLIDVLYMGGLSWLAYDFGSAAYILFDISSPASWLRTSCIRAPYVAYRLGVCLSRIPSQEYGTHDGHTRFPKSIYEYEWFHRRQKFQIHCRLARSEIGKFDAE